jgi:hypothetical protein
MTNIRFPLKLPTSGHPNPYTIDFDFLPNPLISWNNLNADQRNNLYLTRIIINDTDPDTSKIQHIFPDGTVYFIIDDAYNSSISQIADDILNDNLNHVIFGTWVHIADIKDIKYLRNSVQTCFIPTAIVYESVSLTPTILSRIKNYLSVQHNVSKIFGHDVELIKKIKEFLSGTVRFRLNEIDVNTGYFAMPSVMMKGNVRELKIGGIMMDGNGIEKSTITGLVSLLKRNRINGSLFDPDSNDTQRMIVASPINTFLVLSFHLNNENTHPYKRLIDISNPNVFTRYVWDAVLFYKGTPSSISRTKFNFFGYNNKMIKIVENNYEFPLHKSGLFYYPNLDNVNISLIENSLELNLYIEAYGTLTEGTSINLTSNKKNKNYYSIGFGSAPLALSTINNREKYFDIQPTIDNLIPFFEKLSQTYLVSITSAGTFARSMGFLAEAIGHFFEVEGNTIEDRYEGAKYQKPLTSKQTIDVFSSTSVYLFLVKKYIPFGYGFLSDHSFYLSKISGNFKAKCDAILELYDEESFLRTHTDHDDGDSLWGWKTFDSDIDGGHKHHFIFNADSPSLQILGPPYEKFWPNEFLGVNLGGEDQEIDIAYNEKGREFWRWALIEYNPTHVYEKIKELLVENEFT